MTEHHLMNQHLLRKTELGMKLSKVTLQWRHAIDLAVKPMNLTQSSWLAMYYLSRLGDGCSQIILARELGIELPSLTRTLTKLEDDGLIKREASEADRRARLLHFTKKGKTVLEQVQEKVMKIRAQMLAGFSPADHEHLMKLLDRLDNNAQITQETIAAGKPLD
ncbi:transcriptional regulator SlyA [Idiomarina xiamenensis]|uniref:Transcriptional regulator SlyA n=1 Tax=Idiomarina xiamenensis 10-D-4 TaxID=740709 RepID=K2JLY3_9GAMM|nr:transcriptional regulator SlyA [Idiomarina xiamenensis]EKE84516.1 transcriptional regulator SlyA [Idiomarina xiamenensis 10-D-4]